MIVLLALAFIIIGPIFTIAAINVVFGLNIDLNFFTWLGMLWLHAVLAARSAN